MNTSTKSLKKLTIGLIVGGLLLIPISDVLHSETGIDISMLSLLVLGLGIIAFIGLVFALVSKSQKKED